MTSEPVDSERLAPDEAFALLGNETRIEILRALGEADGPLAFSELFDRVEYDDPSNFNYHLKKLADHFVHETGGGYVLRQAGRRVIEAVLAEALADDAVVERTRVEWPCFLCGAPVEVSYRDDHVGLYCSACGGTRDATSPTADGRSVGSDDVLGYLDLPPAGATDRPPADVLQAASVWTTTAAMALARGVCPRCSAAVECSVRACEDHDATDGRCEACGQRFAVDVHYRCTNCILVERSPFSMYLLDDADLIEFMVAHDVDLFTPNGFHMSALEETVHSTEPFEARFTFTVDGDSLTLTVDDDLSVVDVSRGGAPEPGSST